MSTVNYSDVIRASRSVTARNITAEMMEVPDGVSVVLTANGQTIPAQKPVVYLSAVTGRTGLILAPPPIPTISARIVLVNTSSSDQTFNATDATANIKNSVGATVLANTANQYTWNPNDSLWYLLRNLST